MPLNWNTGLNDKETGAITNDSPPTLVTATKSGEEVSRQQSSGNVSRVWLSLGANLGDRAGTLKKAITMIDELPGTHCTALSSLYSTAPVGYTDQPDFLNCAARIETTLSPFALLSRLQGIEKALGRRPRTRWHEREIDIDMLLYEDLTITEENLNIPHPEMLGRGFVLVPLSEIAPDLRHPMWEAPVQTLLNSLTDTSDVEPLDIENWHTLQNNRVGP